MASLSPSTNIGGSASSLIRSAASLSNTVQAYEDSLRAYEYQNSAYTDDAYQSYKDYLNGRITALQATGSIADASKALTLTKTLEAATHSNISASIIRENIQIMGGNASKMDKLNLIGSQFQRALANGDMTLAQSLESQYYGLSQQIQYEAQQAADAASTLAKAGNGFSTGTSGVTYQGEVVTNLTKGLDYLKGLAKNASENELNAAAKEYVQTYKESLQGLGVNIATQQPNYFDVVTGIVGAIYNAGVLKAQAEAPINPLLSRTYAIDAADILTGQTKFQTLAGNLTFSQIQQASADPNMLAYDSSSGTYKLSTTNGFQYQSQIVGYDNKGNPEYDKVLEPVYTGIIGGGPSSKVFYLTPNETAVATKLGLTFTQTDVNKEVAAGHQVGVGVQVQLSNNSPDWLKKVLGDNGVTKLYTDQNGNITFEGSASSGRGMSYYSLVTDANGLSGLFEHTLDGRIAHAGSAYGFNWGAAQMLINEGQQIQQKISLQQQMQAAEAKQLQLSTPAPLPQISVPRPAAPTQNISVPRVSAPSIAPPTINPQKPTVNPQQPAGVSLQGGGINLQGGGGGIRLQ